LFARSVEQGSILFVQGDPLVVDRARRLRERFQSGGDIGGRRIILCEKEAREARRSGSARANLLGTKVDEVFVDRAGEGDVDEADLLGQRLALRALVSIWVGRGIEVDHDIAPAL